MTIPSESALLGNPAAALRVSRFLCRALERSAGWVGFWAVLLGFVPMARAQQTIPLGTDLKVEAAKAAEIQFDLEEFSGKQVRLRMDARIEWENEAGNTPAMEVRVNGQGVEGRQLMNKPLRFTMRGGLALDWTTRDGSSYRLMYAPDFSDRIKTDADNPYGLPSPDQDPFRFVWDITSQVHAGRNVATVAMPDGYKFALRLRDVSLEIGDPIPYKQGADDAKPVRPASTGPLPVYVPKPCAEVAIEAEVSPLGNLRCTLGGRTLVVHSRTSRPNGGWSDTDQADASWQRLERGGAVVARWEGPGYVVQRKATLYADHVSVADTIRNTSDHLVGVMLENRLALPETPQKTCLGGRELEWVNETGDPFHPTVMAEWNDLVVGLAAEDDIFRLHAVLSKEDGAIGLSDRSLGIPPDKAHTLQWSVYFLPNGDYWDFINALRRDWGSNFTLQGPVVFPSDVCFSYVAAPRATADDVRSWLNQMNNAVPLVQTHVAVNPNIAMATATQDRPAFKHGTAILDADDWLANTGKLVRLLQEVAPDVRVFAYLHPNLCTEVGYEQKYRDSVALDKTGKPAKSAYDPPPGLFIPTPTNSYGEALARVYRHLVDDLNANLYIDEMTVGIPSKGAYAEWDGCTVLIDPASHAVTGKLSSSALLMQPWMDSMVQYLRSKGRTALANTAPPTRTMLRWKIQHFTEDVGPSGVIAMHLSTPLAWAYRRDAAGYRHVLESLDDGGIAFSRSGDWNDRMFPLTPLELRAGVVIGKERILTNRSGQFGWGDDSRADVYVFDSQGKQVEKPDFRQIVREFADRKEILTELRLPEDHLAILVRKQDVQGSP